jgi:hypothetical protein
MRFWIAAPLGGVELPVLLDFSGAWRMSRSGDHTLLGIAGFARQNAKSHDSYFNELRGS